MRTRQTRSATVSLAATLAVGLSAGAAHAEPVVADLGLLPGDDASAIATNTQHEPMIALGDGTYLAVWTDFRARSSGSQSIQSDGDIFGIRLDAAGHPIDATPFVIAGGMGLQQRPQVAWNGSAWLVVYVSQDPTSQYFEDRVRAVRVSDAGQVLDEVPLALPPDAFQPNTLGLAVAGSSGEWLVTRFVYHSDGYGTFLAGQRIDAQGTLIDAQPVVLLDWTYGSATVLSASGEYLLAAKDWNDASVTRARRISPDLQPLGAEFTLPSRDIATDGTGYYVTWIRDFVDLVGSPVSPTGTLAIPGGELLVPSVAGNASLAHDGANWWLRWGFNATQRTMRISPAGAVLEPAGVPLPIGGAPSTGPLTGVQLTRRPGGGVLFSWADARGTLGSDSNVFTLPVSSANVPDVESAASIGSTNQRAPSIAAGPDGRAALAYVTEAAGEDRVLLQQLGADGTPLGQAVEVYSGPNVGTVGLAWNGDVYLAAFDVGPLGLTTTQVKARRINPDLTMLDSAAFDVMPGFNASVAALGDDFLVAAARPSANPQFINLFAARIDGPTAALLDGPAGTYLAGSYVNAHPRVRTDGTHWVVLAHSQWSHNSSQSDPLLARVPTAGPPAAAYNPTQVAGGAGDPDYAFSGTVGLCVYRMNTLSNANNFVMGRLMQADGTFFGTPFVIAEAPGRQLRPTVTWTGAEFLVAWDDQRLQQSFFDARTDVYAARVAEDGTLLDPAAFPLGGSSGPECSPALVSIDGVVLAATTRFICDDQQSSYRIGLTRVGTPACPADLNGDGILDFGDVGTFVTAFTASDPAADLNADGIVDFGDVSAFADAFNAGC